MELLGVFGTGDVPGPPEGLVIGGSQLVAAHHEPHLLVAEQGGGHPVADTVDIDEFACFCQTVDRSDVHVGGHGLVTGRQLVLGLPVPDHVVVGGQPVVQPHLVQGDGAAEANGYAVNGAVEIVGCRLGSLEGADAEALGFQVFLHGRKISHTIRSL